MSDLPEKTRRVDRGESTRTAGDSPAHGKRLRGASTRYRMNQWFFRVCVLTASLSVVILLILLGSILYQGAPYLTINRFINGPSSDPEQAGFWPALFGTVWVCTLCGLITLPTGVATAILLEEFRPKNRFARLLHSVIQLNISNLAGVPSVVYGILGLTAFVGMFGLFKQEPLEVGTAYYDQFFSEGQRTILVPVDSQNAPSVDPTEGMFALNADLEPVEIQVLPVGSPLPENPEYVLYEDAEGGRISKERWYYLRFPFGRGVLTGALTLMLVILPIVIIASQEALRSVPNSLRQGALGLGATPWQVVWNVTLPAAIPGIMTGSILAMSRAIGEAAPILMIAGIIFIRNAPGHLMDSFTVMPLQIYTWSARPQAEFHHVAAAGIIMLLAILLSFNAVAVFIRHKMQKPLS